MQLSLQILCTWFFLHFNKFNYAFAVVLHVRAHMFACLNLVVAVAEHKQIKQSAWGLV